MQQQFFEEMDQLLFGVETYAKVLNEKTDQIRDADHLTLIRHFDQVRALYDRMQEVKNDLNKVYDNLNKDYVPEAMRRAGVKTVTVDGVGRVTISHRYSATMLDKEQGIAWLKANGLDAIVQETVNSQTLSATAKNLMETNGKELPSDIFKTGTSPFTSITKVK
jgi:hypothetical protein